jgi:predicted RecA/RadA family phage recombinase
MAQTFVLNSSAIGVDLNNFNPTALFAVGTHVLGNNGTEWVYIHAATSIQAFRMVAVNTVSYTAGMASGADVLSGSQLAVAQTTISAQSFGWVAIRGVGLTVWCNSSATAPTTIGVFLATQSASTGAITVFGSGSGTLAGAQIVDGAATTTSTGSLVTVNLSWPRTVTQFG